MRHWILRREAYREQRYVAERARSAQVGVLDTQSHSLDIVPHKGDTFFILGSGASVENLGDKEFFHIREHTSVGINSWPLHSFVPDIYAYETVPEKDSDYSKVLGLLDRKDVLEQRPAILILRPKTAEEIAQLEQIPATLRDRIFFYGRVTPATRSQKWLGDDLSHILQRVNTAYPAVLPDSGASIIRMAALGILMGFTRIVFVGVDLNNTEYFWERNPGYLSLRGLESFENRQTQQQHETLSKNNRPFIVTEVLRSLEKVFQQRYGGELFVASAESALTEFMPVYQWGSTRSEAR